MILIVTEKIDETTNLTLKWLNYYKQEYTVITNPVYVSFIGLENFVIKLKNKNIKLTDIDFVWFRRQRIRLKLIDNLQNVDTLKKYHYVTLRYLENHLNQLIVKNIKTLGCPFKLDLNKLEILNIAKEIGFKIPKSTLSESKSDFKAIFNSQSMEEAMGLFWKWGGSVLRYNIDEMKKVAKMFNNHLVGVCNAMVETFSNAMAERLNGKIQEIKSRARGYRTFKNFRSAILFFHGGLQLYPLFSQ